MYEKINWNNYNDDLTFQENLENNAVATDTLLNHMDYGIYKANNFSVGTVVTADEPNAFIIDTGEGYTIDFELPRGEKGKDGVDGLQGIQGERGEPGVDGKNATITIGTVTEGDTAQVTNSGTDTEAVLDFVIPNHVVPGEPGKAATITIGTVLSVDPNIDASVVNTGTETDAILNFAIPRGEKGDQGDEWDSSGLENKIDESISKINGNIQSLENRKVNSSGWEANMTLRTDESGNVIATEDLSDKANSVFKWENVLLESGTIKESYDPLQHDTNVTLETLRKYHTFMIGFYCDEHTQMTALNVVFNGEDAIPLLRLSCAAFKCIFEWVDTEHSILAIKDMTVGDATVLKPGITGTNTSESMIIDATSKSFHFYHDAKKDDLTDCISFRSTNGTYAEYSYEIVGLLSHNTKPRDHQEDDKW